MALSKGEIAQFVKVYSTHLEKIVKENIEEIEKASEKTGTSPPFPINFPVQTMFALGNNAILFKFEKSSIYSSKFIENQDTIKTIKWDKVIPFSLFSKLKENPHKAVEIDVNEFLAFPSKLEAYLDQEQERAEEQFLEMMEYEMNYYVDYLKRTDKVLDKTMETKTADLFEIKTIILNHLQNQELMWNANRRTLWRIHFMINADMETALFLSLHGKYNYAIAILRKILEVNIRCIYLDSQSGRSYSDEQIDVWLNGGSFVNRKSFKKLVDDIMVDIDDDGITNLINKWGSAISSFKESIPYLYRELNAFVHLRPSTDHDFDAYFSEFDDKKWDAFSNKFLTVLRIVEILLIVKFPDITSEDSNQNKDNNYASLILSKDQIKEIMELS